METYKDEARNIDIRAGGIEIGTDVVFGSNIKIRLKGVFRIGDRSRLGDDVEIMGNNVSFGADLFHSRGLRVGGGGRQHPNANLRIGDRCTIHNNFINVCEKVTLGDDVGLSPEVSILTHGYWMSVLEGYPAMFAGVSINSGAIVGYRSLIMMGVTVGEGCVIGAQSVVTKDTKPRCVYAGSPARMIKEIRPLSQEKKEAMVHHVLDEYRSIAAYHGVSPSISLEYPFISVNDCRFDVKQLTFEGREDEETDDFRDYVRKWGLRFYSRRPFRSVWEW